MGQTDAGQPSDADETGAHAGAGHEDVDVDVPVGDGGSNPVPEDFVSNYNLVDFRSAVVAQR